MPHGTVKFFNADQGFGFITPFGGGRDVLVQATEVVRSGLGELLVGQRIRFEIADRGHGHGDEAVELSLMAANEDDGRLKRFG
ncbi:MULTISPECIES: cold-shock protein [Hyphobacterium]|uniref:Cold-shock protein n=1 Tax=Hyphobacterium vulgare TaxID=1736751 RepID=A0ABV7A0E7_9PROT